MDFEALSNMARIKGEESLDKKTSEKEDAQKESGLRNTGKRENVSKKVVIELTEGEFAYFKNKIDAVLEAMQMDEYFYKEAAYKLFKGGIDINRFVLNSLTPEKAKDEKYLEGLIELNNAKIVIDGALIYNLTLENAKDVNYRAGLIELHDSGIQVDGYMLDGLSSLTLKKTEDREYMKMLIKNVGRVYNTDLEYLLKVDHINELDVDKMYFGNNFPSNKLLDQHTWDKQKKLYFEQTIFRRGL